jgi:hypothetical protein
MTDAPSETLIGSERVALPHVLQLSVCPDLSVRVRASMGRTGSCSPTSPPRHNVHCASPGCSSSLLSRPTRRSLRGVSIWTSEK